MDNPAQSDILVYILGVILDLLHNDGWHEAFPISSGKDK